MPGRVIEDGEVLYKDPESVFDKLGHGYTGSLDDGFWDNRALRLMHDFRHQIEAVMEGMPCEQDPDSYLYEGYLDDLDNNFPELHGLGDCYLKVTRLEGVVSLLCARMATLEAELDDIRAATNGGSFRLAAGTSHDDTDE